MLSYQQQIPETRKVSKEQINDASQAAGNFPLDTLSENKAQINDASGSKMSEG